MKHQSYGSSATPCNRSTFTIAAANGDRESPLPVMVLLLTLAVVLSHLCSPADAAQASLPPYGGSPAGCSACCWCLRSARFTGRFRTIASSDEWCDELALSRMIRENAADMIAVVDVNGRRLYNSPSYEKVLGYSTEELERTDSFEQIHPDDRELVQAGGASRRGKPGRAARWNTASATRTAPGDFSSPPQT